MTYASRHFQLHDGLSGNGFGDRFCVSGKGGTGGGGWEGTNSMAVSALAHEKPLVVWSRVGWTGTDLWVVGESN